MEMPKPGPAHEKFSLFAGSWAGDTLSLTSESPMGHSRCTFVFSQAGKYTFRLESSQDGSRWAPFIEGSYTRR